MDITDVGKLFLGAILGSVCGPYFAQVFAARHRHRTSMKVVLSEIRANAVMLAVHCRLPRDDSFKGKLAPRLISLSFGGFTAVQGQLSEWGAPATTLVLTYYSFARRLQDAVSGHTAFARHVMTPPTGDARYYEEHIELALIPRVAEIDSLVRMTRAIGRDALVCLSEDYRRVRNFEPPQRFEDSDDPEALKELGPLDWDD